MIFGYIVKQLISCLLLSILLTQSVLAGIVNPLELNNYTLTKVEHQVNNHNIEPHCTYDDNALGVYKNALIDSEETTHQCHHHNTLFFLFYHSRLIVSYNLNKVIFINHANFNSNIMEPPFKPPIIL